MLGKGHGWVLLTPCTLRRRVYWYNPDTGLLEFCIAKSANLAMAVHHPNGWWGLRTNALLEAAALEWLEDVPGVVDIRDIIIHPNGPIVLIMECVPDVPLPSFAFKPIVLVLASHHSSHHSSRHGLGVTPL